MNVKILSFPLEERCQCAPLFFNGLHSFLLNADLRDNMSRTGSLFSRLKNVRFGRYIHAFFNQVMI